MGLHALVYITILALGLFGATGIGLFGPSGGANGLSPSVGIAAPLADDDDDDDDDDNGDDDDDTDNGDDDDDDTDNGEGDNGEGDNGEGDNGEDNEGVVATSPTPTPTPQPAQPAQPAQPTQPQPVPIPVGPCEFRLGFKTLHDMIPTQVGNCVTNETYNPVNGDSLQVTTGGLMVWRKADNWTAFTNGSTTWLNGPCGLQSRPNEKKFPWEGQPGAVCIPGEAT